MFQQIPQPQQPAKMKVTLALMLCAALFVVSDAVFRGKWGIGGALIDRGQER